MTDDKKTIIAQRKVREGPFLSMIAKAMVRQRQALGLTQSTVAELSGLHRTYVSDIERGRRNVTLESLVRMSLALNISLSQLCRLAESEVENTD